jgi:hypothetical protein
VLSAQAQQLGQPAGSSQGTLTVTVRVVPSVGIVFGADGEPLIVVANEIDTRDNVSRLQRDDARTGGSAAVPSPSRPDRESSKQSSRAPVRDGTSCGREHLL